MKIGIRAMEHTLPYHRFISLLARALGSWNYHKTVDTLRWPVQRRQWDAELLRVFKELIHANR